jgi:hypothetical protein
MYIFTVRMYVTVRTYFDPISALGVFIFKIVRP